MLIDGMQVCYPNVSACDSSIIPESCSIFAHAVGPDRVLLATCFRDIRGAHPAARAPTPEPRAPSLDAPTASRPPSPADIEANRAKWLALLSSQQQKRVITEIRAARPPARFVDTWIQGGGTSGWSLSKDCESWASAAANNDAHDKCFAYPGGLVVRGSIKYNKVWIQSHWTGNHFVYQCSTTANVTCRHVGEP